MAELDSLSLAASGTTEASEVSSPRPELTTSVTSAEIELRQCTSAKSDTRTISKLTEIEMTEVTPFEPEPKTQPVTSASETSSERESRQPTSADSETRTSPKVTDIEMTEVTPIAIKPKSTSRPASKSASSSSSETETTSKPPASKPAARPSVTFAPEALKPEATSSREATSSMTSTPKREKEQKRWTAVEEADARKGFVISLKRAMGCGSSLDAMYDDPMPVVVFGATGLVGGAVARALLRDRRFEVKAVTRTPTTDVARKLAEEGAIIVTADLNDPRSVNRAVEGAHAVFLVTHYWEHMNKDKEIQQLCPYTALRLPFYFENLLSVFRPHKVRPGVFAVALPMEDKPMDCICVKDVGRCVVNVLLRPKAHLCRVLPVTAEKLTVQQITDTLNKHFSDRKFICPKIRVKDYEGFDFKGSKDIAGMFQFYQEGQELHDVKVTRKVNNSLCSFDRWVVENKQKLAEAMNVPE